MKQNPVRSGRVSGRARAVLVGLGILFAHAASAQDITRVTYSLLHGNVPLNSKIEIYGYIDKWQSNPAGNTWAYELKDDWGDAVTVVTDKGLPPTKARYKVSGIVNYDPQAHEYRLTELQRDGIGMPGEASSVPAPPPPDPRQPQFDALLGRGQGLVAGGKLPEAIAVLQDAVSLGQSMNPTPAALGVAQAQLRVAGEAARAAKKRAMMLYGLVGGVVVVGGALLWMLKQQPREERSGDFPAGAVISVSDLTQKIKAPVATPEAVQAGTVKVLPGRFEVKGGVDIKEIRLIRPRGVSDHEIEYTFGRLNGDSIRHIQLDDSTVSSQQARLRFGREGYLFLNIPDPEDANRNASQINGTPLKASESRLLREGDVIRMGKVELVFHAE